MGGVGKSPGTTVLTQEDAIMLSLRKSTCLTLITKHSTPFSQFLEAVKRIRKGSFGTLIKSE